MEAIAKIIAEAPMWLQAIAGIITACTAFTMLTPTKVDDKLFGVLTKGVNVLLKLANMGSGNILKNKNKDER
jgi:hypothetical protein